MLWWTNNAHPNLVQPFYQAIIAQGHHVLVHDELPLAAPAAVDVVVVDEFHREAIAKSKTNNRANLPKIRSVSMMDSRFMGAKLHHQVLPRIADRQFVECHIAQRIAGVVVRINRHSRILPILIFKHNIKCLGKFLLQKMS